MSVRSMILANTQPVFRPNPMPTSTFICHSCGADVTPFAGISGLAGVTSDCKPLPAAGLSGHCPSCGVIVKRTDADWQQRVEQIYEDYTMYDQGAGAEQAVFDADTGANMRRSQQIISEISKLDAFPAGGDLLDIGCGNGAFLSAFADSFPGWRLSGQEWGVQNREHVLSLQNVESFYTSLPHDRAFDAISLVHVLEHITNPVSYLRHLTSMLKPGGMLILETPNIARNPFDLAIYDHCSHFTMQTLHGVLEHAGYRRLHGSEDCVAKELTVFAQPTATATDGTTSTDDAPGEQACAWLSAFGDKISAETAGSKFGIFGSSIAATWFVATFPERALFFIDDDPARIGSKHLSLPIYPVDDAPKDIPLVIALIDEIAVKVGDRLARAGFEHILLPADSRHVQERKTNV